MTVSSVERITVTEPDGTTVSVSGERGPQGPTGATGATGVVAATAPATYNSGTQTVGVTLGTTANTAAEGSHTHAIDGLLPSQTGNSGKVLQTNGSAASWATVAGGGSSNPEDESTVIASRLFG